MLELNSAQTFKTSQKLFELLGAKTMDLLDLYLDDGKNDKQAALETKNSAIDFRSELRGDISELKREVANLN